MNDDHQVPWVFIGSEGHAWEPSEGHKLDAHSFAPVSLGISSFTIAPNLPDTPLTGLRDVGRVFADETDLWSQLIQPCMQAGLFHCLTILGQNGADGGMAHPGTCGLVAV